jgi:hypothetical protein
MHHKVWEFYNGVRRKGYHIHHINGNSWDNRIENLEEVEAFKHLSEHAKNMSEEHKKKFQEAGIEAAKEWHSSEEGKIWHSEHGKKIWEDREYIKKICEECGNEYETRHSGISKFCHLNCRAKSNRRSRKLRISTSL